MNFGNAINTPTGTPTGTPYPKGTTFEKSSSDFSRAMISIPSSCTQTKFATRGSIKRKFHNVQNTKLSRTKRELLCCSHVNGQEVGVRAQEEDTNCPEVTGRVQGNFLCNWRQLTVFYICGRCINLCLQKPRTNITSSIRDSNLF